MIFEPKRKQRIDRARREYRESKKIDYSEMHDYDVRNSDFDSHKNSNDHKSND